MCAVWPRQNGKRAAWDTFRERALSHFSFDEPPRRFIFEGHAIDSIEHEQHGDAFGRLTVQLKTGF